MSTRKKMVQISFLIDQHLNLDQLLACLHGKIVTSKPSSLKHLNHCTKLRMTLLKCFAVEHSVFKAKHLRSVVEMLKWASKKVF